MFQNKLGKTNSIVKRQQWFYKYSKWFYLNISEYSSIYETEKQTLRFYRIVENLIEDSSISSIGSAGYHWSFH